MSFIGLWACESPESSSTNRDASGAISPAPSLVSEAALLSASCVNCHSISGDGAPTLAGLSKRRIEQDLLRYKTELDKNTVMHRYTKGLSEVQIKQIADHLGHNPAGLQK